MPKAYSADLRRRVWAAYVAGEGTQARVARRFAVSVSFVRDLARRVRESGGIRARPHGGGAPRKADAALGAAVARLARERNDATLAEHCAALAQTEGAQRVSVSTVWRVLEGLKLTRKKENLARQRAR
jgi:transposase